MQRFLFFFSRSVKISSKTLSRHLRIRRIRRYRSVFRAPGISTPNTHTQPRSEFSRSSYFRLLSHSRRVITIVVFTRGLFRVDLYPRAYTPLLSLFFFFCLPFTRARFRSAEARSERLIEFPRSIRISETNPLSSVYITPPRVCGAKGRDRPAMMNRR